MIHYSIGDLPEELYLLHDRMITGFAGYRLGQMTRHNAVQMAAVFLDEVERFRSRLDQPKGGEQWDKKRDRRECC